VKTHHNIDFAGVAQVATTDVHFVAYHCGFDVGPTGWNEAKRPGGKVGYGGVHAGVFELPQAVQPAAVWFWHGPGQPPCEPHGAYSQLFAARQKTKGVDSEIYVHAALGGRTELLEQLRYQWLRGVECHSCYDYSLARSRVRNGSCEI
jgi:hypothetical protein